MLSLNPSPPLPTLLHLTKFSDITKVDYSARYLRQIENSCHIFKNVHACFLNQKPIDVFLTKFFRKNRQFGSKDRRLISNSIFGFYRWYGWLSQLMEKELEKALLLGYLLDSNPVDQLVLFWGKQCGLADHVIQNLHNNRNNGFKEKGDVISSIISNPDPKYLNPSLLHHWSDSVIDAFQKRPNIWIRLTNFNQQRFLEFLDSKEVSYRYFPNRKDVLEILSPINLYESKDYNLGYLEVQDISSQAVGLICRPGEGEIWWDVCAGSGGKTLHLASLMNGSGSVVASEIYPKRFNELIKRSNKNKKLKNIKPILWNGKIMPVFDRQPDGVLVDAPCSCSGTWRRSPDLRWHITQQKIAYYASLQFKLLSNICKEVPKNGVLVYATCSVFEEENELVVNRFLETHTDFSLQPITCPFTTQKSEKGLRLFPPNIDGNGMYIARLIRF